MNIADMLFQGWSEILRTVLVGALAYAALVLLLRLSGKRTLSKLNAFDLVVTVALGSTLSSILLQESISLAEGTAAMALLIGMQFLATFASVRWKPFAKMLRSEPSLLVHDGKPCEKAMRSARVTSDEALGAVRAAGGDGLVEVRSLILESNGTFSVVFKDPERSPNRPGTP